MGAATFAVIHVTKGGSSGLRPRDEGRESLGFITELVFFSSLFHPEISNPMTYGSIWAFKNRMRKKNVDLILEVL